MHFFVFDLLNLWFSTPRSYLAPPRLFGTREYAFYGVSDIKFHKNYDKVWEK